MEWANAGFLVNVALAYKYGNINYMQNKISCKVAKKIKKCDEFFFAMKPHWVYVPCFPTCVRRAVRLFRTTKVSKV